MRLEEIHWLDHEGRAGWTDAETIAAWAQAPVGTMVSWGLVVYENDEAVTIAAALHASGWGDCQKILKSDIVSREVVREWE